MNRDRWHALMAHWSFDPNDEVFEQLQAAWNEAHRHYHSAAHLDACLKHLDGCLSQLDQAHEVELALWFHDAIYKPFSSSNEQDSADWAASFLSDNGAPGEVTDRVHRLIMVTEHDAPTQTSDESLLVDIDLAILGAPTEVYERFETDVRKEYRWVPWFLYRKKRAEILSGFLARERIYQNEPFVSDREPQARVNLSSALKDLH